MPQDLPGWYVCGALFSVFMLGFAVGAVVAGAGA